MKQLSGATSQLEKIDELRKLGLHELVPLPQIVVVGDQSSGKSALLEYISGVTFPKDAGMCTSFVTEVRMRPATDFSASVLINGQADPRLESPTSPKAVADVIAKAKTLFMEQDANPNAVYEEILTVEINGPDMRLLTLVDLPGYVHTHSEGQSPSIIAEIEALAEKYIKSDQTIVLAVIAANRDFETNVALNHIRAHDPTGTRTLCVLTKPDMVDLGTEHRVLEIMEGKKMPLSRGYHIIRNRNYEECKAGESFEMTSKKEAAFFDRGPWSLISISDKGIEPLIGKLAETLDKHVEKGFFGIKSKIFTDIEKLRHELAVLGPSLEPDFAKAALLSNNIITFNRALKSLVDGNYSNEEYKPQWFIRAHVQKNHSRFYDAIMANTREELQYVEVEKITTECRGRELGGMLQFQPFIMLSREVIRSWLLITNKHIDDLCDGFLDVIKQVNCAKTNPMLVDFFSQQLTNFICGQKKRMYHDAAQIFDDEQMPTTQNCSFLENWLKANPYSAPKSQEKHDTCRKPVLYYADSDQIPPNAENAKEEETKALYKVLEAYSDIAAKRYVDAICLYVVERHLYKRCDERITEWLTRDKGALENIKESSRTTHLRKELPEKIAKLKKGASIL